MKQFEVITNTEMLTKYIVKAKNKKEITWDLYWVDVLKQKVVGYRNEQIESIEEITNV